MAHEIIASSQCARNDRPTSVPVVASWSTAELLLSAAHGQTMMAKEKTKRVGIFHADWPLQCHTTNAAIMLASSGYEVDLFLYQAPSYVDMATLRPWKTVHVHDLSPSPSPLTALLKGRFPRLARLTTPLRMAARTLAESLSVVNAYRYLLGSTEGLLAGRLVGDALNAMGDKSYACLIGVEKLGLIWAGEVAKRVPVPLIYYSLEIYTTGFQGLERLRHIAFSRLRVAEQRYHRAAAATIIQDPDRAQILFEANGVSISELKIFYVPVSVTGHPYVGTSRFLHETLGLPRSNGSFCTSVRFSQIATSWRWCARHRGSRRIGRSSYMGGALLACWIGSDLLTPIER